ncbi:lipoprotein [Spiroplasma endosymbiont of Ammophila pubescens]|uniref:lipoprotein n=1 Tax=Spiroplasma endosymbiont of Ammophila pubescens TaxID=3066315 RepID=UPI0032B1D254
MKKIISILGAIGLTTTSTTSLISCEKPNNNENGGNKPEPWYNPQQPPENSNWKLITTIENVDKYKWEDKTYIGIVKKQQTDDFSIIKFNFSDKSVWNVGAPYHTINGV